MRHPAFALALPLLAMRRRARPGLLAALLILAGCGSTGPAPVDGGPGDAGVHDAGSDAGGEADAGPGPADGGGEADGGGQDPCTGEGLAAGDHTLSLEHDGVTRTALVYVPEGLTPGAAVPLVLNFHGYTSNANQQALYSRVPAKADQAHFIAVHPQGLNAGWNAGSCCGTSSNEGVDDVGFVRALVAELRARVCLDPRRVYAMGLSNGAMMSHRLACEAADLVAAAGPVAGGLMLETCAPSRPVPVMHFHGSADAVVPYYGNALTGFPSIPEVMAGWAARDGCDAEAQELLTSGATVCEGWPGCGGDAEVTLCTTWNDGHVWPGSAGSISLIDATESLWDFFSRHALP